MLALCLLLGAGGCARHAENEGEFRELIRQYDQRLAMAFDTYDLKPFGQSLTASHFNRLDHRMTGMKRAGQKMESRVLAIEFLEFKDLGDKQLGFPRFRVKTREVWNVRHIDARTGKVVKEVKGLVYELSYEFEQHDGVWQVDAVEVLGQKIPS
ncbi:hypothetical protein [Geobacter sp.]|uniref:hypothetical protein n=1 Tax=Geobacter sp. TaxID=46610 RepID=UPI002610A191|nr:hypothetical protein [Geobacter sp.]